LYLSFSIYIHQQPLEMRALTIIPEDTSLQDDISVNMLIAIMSKKISHENMVSFGSNTTQLSGKFNYGFSSLLMMHYMCRQMRARRRVMKSRVMETKMEAVAARRQQHNAASLTYHDTTIFCCR